MELGGGGSASAVGVGVCGVVGKMKNGTGRSSLFYRALPLPSMERLGVETVAPFRGNFAAGSLVGRRAQRSVREAGCSRWLHAGQITACLRWGRAM